jgi:hypothetical protein
MANLKIEPKTVSRSFYIKGVRFEISLNEYVSIRKHQRDFSMEEHLFQTRSLEMPQFTTPEPDIIKAWETVKPITPVQAIKLFHNNSQQLMTVLSIMGPEATFKALKSKVKDQQTITKTQKRTFLKDDSSINFEKTKRENSPSVASDLFETKEVTYNDTYTLHEIDPSQFNSSRTDETLLDNPIYVLQVECPSTHNHYFIFVDSEEPQCQDAIGAVAWTMIKDDGSCLTKDEYMKLQAEA